MRVFSASLASLGALPLLQVSAQSQPPDVVSLLPSLSGSIASTVSSLPTAETNPNITYSSGQVTRFPPTSTSSSAATVSLNGTASASGSISTTEEALTTIVGGQPDPEETQSGSTVASATSSAPTTENTIPCNGHPQFCSRRYSNITQITSHNSAFAVENNAASNQEYPIEVQLNDGIRSLQGQTHLINGTMYSCHTSCDLLNAGPYTSMLDEVASWVAQHPYDVVTIFVGNSGWPDGVTALDYRETFEESEIFQYLYEPQYVPQRREQWPTLAQMILTGKRVVAFIDYNANQDEVPYLLDEYSHFWSTPFSPTDRNFPCTMHLPLELDDETAKEDFMYIANHNLNVNVAVAGMSILIPDTYNIEHTNGRFNVFGQLGAMVSNCTEKWDLPPTQLVVDYYNRGDPEPGSVFEVAARANNVTYDGDCCGTTSAGTSARKPLVDGRLFIMLALAVLVHCMV